MRKNTKFIRFLVVFHGIIAFYECSMLPYGLRELRHSYVCTRSLLVHWSYIFNIFYIYVIHESGCELETFFAKKIVK